jgi:hypothetical protein
MNLELPLSRHLRHQNADEGQSKHDGNSVRMA